MLNELDQHFKIGKWSTKVMVVNGDLCSPNLGLSEEDYSLICDTVNVIIHNGAVVNAALPYQGKKAARFSMHNTLFSILCIILRIQNIIAVLIDTYLTPQHVLIMAHVC